MPFMPDHALTHSSRLCYSYLFHVLFASETLFLCPRHEMAEGHIEFTLSVCVCVPEPCPGHNLAIHNEIGK